ncbi:hypothetical protein FQR65_LT13531 [Abscondita terminalis]|nr:hypothetical protein FQR65_LT13531 [Abscondita terminalis]
MTRGTFEQLVVEVGNSATNTIVGRPQEDFRLQCLVTIWTLANQESYRSIADRFNIAKSTVFIFICRISTALNKLGSRYIQWPQGRRVSEVIEGFKRKKSFPGVLGAVDGSHIDICAPKENAAAYINRKGRPSILLQGVCDHQLIFTDCFIGYPGSVHDARVFQNQDCKTDVL